MGQKGTRLPEYLVWVVVLVCILPVFLNQLGISFASQSVSLDAANFAGLAKADLVDSLHRSLAGSFLHVVLEWSAFSVAIFTCILAFSHFSRQSRHCDADRRPRSVLCRVHGCSPYSCGHTPA